MSSWRTATIGQLVIDNVIEAPMDGNHGETHPKSADFVDSGIPFVMASDIENSVIDLIGCNFIPKNQADQLRKGFAVEGDVLLTHKATIGRTAVVPQLETEYIMLTPQATYYRVKNKQALNNHFLKYFFDSKPFQETLGRWAGSGSTRAYLGIQGQHHLPVRLPDIDTQIGIADVLSALDAKIELNYRINAQLEAMAKTIYDFWFVQYDFPDQNGRPYKSSGGKMLYSDTLKLEIPEGWEQGSLWDIATYFNGLVMQNFRPIGAEYLPVVKIREMNDGFSEASERAHPDIPEDAIVNDGDVLFSWSATLIVKIWSQGQGALNQHIFKVTSDKYPKAFYYFELRNYLNHFKMLANLRKTTMGHITQDHLKQAKICIPPIELLKAANERIEPIFVKQLYHDKEIGKLKQLRDCK